MKILIIGLDGATWKLLDPWINQGKLPFLAKLKSQGIWGNLQSTIPPLTAPAWVSFQTGVNPGQHGIFDFVIYQKDGQDKIVESTDIKTPTLYQLLSQANKTSIFINLPVSYPPQKTKGIIISSLLTPPGKDFASPQKIQKKLKKINYQIDVKFERYGFFTAHQKILENKENLYQEIVAITQKRAETALMLMKQSWDLFFLLFRGSDEVQHLYWRKRKTLEYWQLLEKLIKKIYQTAKKKYGKNLYFLIISDHGFHKGSKIQFSLTPWLKKKGFIKKAKKENISLLLARKAYQLTKKFVPLFIESSPLQKTRKKLLNKELGENLQFVRSQDVWAASFGLYLNKKDPRLKKRLISELRKERYQGRKVFKFVKPGEEVFWGKYRQEGPTIVFLSNQNFLPDPGYFQKKIYQPIAYPLPARHHSDPKGILIALGPGVKRGEVKKVKIYDLAPTILALLGIFIPQKMEGEVIGKLVNKKVKYISEKEKIKTLIEKAIKALK